jgi:mRNA-degrading endonuclease RelE of RelBE toxin-antitoxin system
MEHRIEFTGEARDHLGSLSARDRAMLLDVAREQLTYEPSRPTRKRKPMRPNPLAPWVLRIGHLRVYYEVTQAPVPCVTIRAIGVKVRERVLVGGLEIDLS